MVTNDPHSMEHGFQVYLDRTRRLKQQPRYTTLEDWAASPAGVRYAAAHGLQSALQPEAPPDQVEALLNQLAALLVQRTGQQVDMKALAQPQPVFVQGFQPRNAPALPPGYTYGRCTLTRRGVQQVTIRVPFDQLQQAVAALHDAQGDD